MSEVDEKAIRRAVKQEVERILAEPDPVSTLREMAKEMVDDWRSYREWPDIIGDDVEDKED